jgi:asparagine synthetase B (glutamine-hydrolysing)
MCGLSGIICNSLEVEDHIWMLESYATNLARLAGRRGQDSLGLSSITPLSHENIKISEGNLNAFLGSGRFKTAVQDWSQKNELKALFVFNRLEIVGTKHFADNNGPIEIDGIIGMHNGIVCNASHMWELSEHKTPTLDVDSEVLFALLSEYWRDQRFYDYIKLLKSHLKGSFTLAAYDTKTKSFFFSTNTGSLYYIEDNALTAFSSERCFLVESELLKIRPDIEVKQLEPWAYKVIDFAKLSSSTKALSPQ